MREKHRSPEPRLRWLLGLRVRNGDVTWRERWYHMTQMWLLVTRYFCLFVPVEDARHWHSVCSLNFVLCGVVNCWSQSSPALANEVPILCYCQNYDGYHQLNVGFREVFSRFESQPSNQIDLRSLPSRLMSSTRVNDNEDTYTQLTTGVVERTKAGLQLSRIRVCPS